MREREKERERERDRAVESKRARENGSSKTYCVTKGIV